MTIIQRIEIPVPFLTNRVNAYFIQDAVPTLVDTGANTDEGINALGAALGELGFSLNQIKRIILTHGHVDHLGSAGRIAQISSAEVFIHKEDTQRIRREASTDLEETKRGYDRFFTESGLCDTLKHKLTDRFTKLIETYVSPMSEESVLYGDEMFEFDDFRLRVIHSPGHSPGSICLLQEQDSTLFSGDTLLENIAPNPVVEVRCSDGPGRHPILSRYHDTLDRLTSLPVDQILPGHGSPFSGHRKQIDLIKRHHRYRKETILRILRRTHETDGIGNMGGWSLYQIAKTLFQSALSQKSLFICLSEIRSHLECLEQEGVIAAQPHDGTPFYSAAG